GSRGTKREKKKGAMIQLQPTLRIHFFLKLGDNDPLCMYLIPGGKGAAEGGNFEVVVCGFSTLCSLRVRKIDPISIQNLPMSVLLRVAYSKSKTKLDFDFDSVLGPICCSFVQNQKRIKLKNRRHRQVVCDMSMPCPDSKTSAGAVVPQTTSTTVPHVALTPALGSSLFGIDNRKTRQEMSKYVLLCPFLEVAAVSATQTAVEQQTSCTLLHI
ncbi:unnamed protein product, partial [Pylaiella littoralis]